MVKRMHRFGNGCLRYSVDNGHCAHLYALDRVLQVTHGIHARPPRIGLGKWARMENEGGFKEPAKDSDLTIRILRKHQARQHWDRLAQLKR